MGVSIGNGPDHGYMARLELTFQGMTHSFLAGKECVCPVLVIVCHSGLMTEARGGEGGAECNTVGGVLDRQRLLFPKLIKSAIWFGGGRVIDAIECLVVVYVLGVNLPGF
jgi:hypothetical protein